MISPRLRVVAGLAAFLTVSVAQPLPDAQAAFEAASIRIIPASRAGYTSLSPYGTNRYSVTNASLEFLIQLAFDVPYQQISGTEKLGSEHYDLTAKAEDGVALTYQQLQPRMQNLLAERFKLAVHREQKEVDGYALVIARGGPKLQPSDGASRPGSIYPGGLQFHNASLKMFAESLRSAAGRPVFDKTGIEGNYDFVLNYARDNDPDSTLPSFFTALTEKYRLKLEKSKVPLEILVIDHVEKVPVEN